MGYDSIFYNRFGYGPTPRLPRSIVARIRPAREPQGLPAQERDCEAILCHVQAALLA